MDVVYMVVRRKEVHFFLEAKETATLLEVKRMIEGITKVKPEDQRVVFKNCVLEDQKSLADHGLTAHSTKAFSPAEMDLAVRDEATGEFETFQPLPISQPPELPDVLKLPPSADADEREVRS